MRKQEALRLSRDSLPVKSSKPKKLYISWRHPGKGPTAFSALYPSLILAPAGLRLADEREWKLRASKGILDGIYSACICLPCIMRSPWQQAHVSMCYMERDCTLLGESDHVPLPSWMLDWALPWVSLLSFHMLGMQRNVWGQHPNFWKHHRPRWRHVGMEFAPAAVGMPGDDQKLRLSTFPVFTWLLHLAVSEGLEMKGWPRHWPALFCFKKCDLWRCWYQWNPRIRTWNCYSLNYLSFSHFTKQNKNPQK